MTVINTNVNSLVAKNAIQGNARNLATAMERLSTGNRINSAKDDAAGLAISSRMNAQTRGLSMAIRNANDGISLMQTTEGALGEVTDILQRMRELAVQSVNGTNNASDRVALNDEVQQLKAEIERIATSTEFNNQKLLDGSYKGRELQIGDKAGQVLKVDIASARLDALGLSGAGSAGGSQTLVGGRWAAADFDEGDILINGQELKAHDDTGGDDLEDLIDNINENVDNVLASGFNEVVAKNVGDGVTTDGQFDITVTALGAGNSTTYEISASENLQELVDNINAEAGGAVSARLNDEGKLVLFNTTGASITVIDASSAASAYDGGSGFAATSATFAGFLKLESRDGSPIRIETGETGTIADIQSLGFNEVTSDFAVGDDAYTVTGKGLTAPTGAWGASDIKINGVAIYDENIATTTFAGKLEAINAFSNETGVVANGYYDEVVSITATNLTNIAGTLLVNGVAVTTAVTSGSSVAAYAARINNKTSAHGVTAEVVNDGAALRLTGYVNSVVLTGTAATVGGFTAGVVDYAAIRLDSVNNTPIGIELGDDALIAEHGFLEANVGAADFQVNGASLGSASGSSLSGLDVSSLAGATAAISSIDNAIQTVGASRSKLGAMQNRLDSTVNNLSNIVANTEASRSRIQDTDYASETTALARAQIIQQAATAMLAQANQQPQTVLSLLQ
jgi:flagellin